MWSGLSRVVLYVLIVTLPVGLTTWLGDESEGIVIDVGRNLALTGFMILIMQFLLAARVKWIERAFGFDILIRFHKYMALTAAFFLLLHPLLLALGGMGWKLLIGLDLPWYIWVGKAALILVLANVLVSKYQDRLGLSFEKWRLGHDVLAPVVLLGIFLHSWFAGDDLELLSMQVLWVGAFVLAASMFVYHRFLRPNSLRKQSYKVQEVKQEAGDVWTISLVPPPGQGIPEYHPGQFHFLTFFRDPALPVEEHHWTISSSPSQKEYISSTIKAVGDFTSTIGRTQPGDTAAVHGPFGRFSYALHPQERDLVFLAGGIGITPLMAMLRHMRDTRDTRSVTLLYANRREDQIVFRQELEEIAAGQWPNLQLVHVLSRPEGHWSGESGHIDQEKIEKFCGHNLTQKAYYVCGPPRMSQTLITTLRDIGVPDNRIRHEIFSFLD
ncbi:MAG: ferredoxin reductase family protein [Desulfovermiculus sp.]|nr:ferredoxin reductase family protein [Desulfovermiculus sp.]